jgi:acyl-[acyl-carrier-protein] desaturase
VDDATLLRELTPTAESLYERHLAQTKEWFPHEYVPWERGPSVVVGRPWVPADSGLPEAVRSALYVNLLTEDNLPYYTRDVWRLFDAQSPKSADVWREWTRRWTAEEARHSVALRDYAILSRIIDPKALEDGRMVQMCGGIVPDPPGLHHALAYLTLQELATRISHRNVHFFLAHDPTGQEVMKRVAADENLHHLFYRDLASAALAVDTSAMVLAITDEVLNFAMPGLGIPGFAAHSKAIARSGIYNFRVHHEQILVPVVLRHWNVEALEGLTPEAEQARDKLVAYIERIGRIAQRSERVGALPR